MKQEFSEICHYSYFFQEDLRETSSVLIGKTESIRYGCVIVEEYPKKYSFTSW